MNPVIAVTAIIAAMILGNVIVYAVRDVAKAKHRATPAPSVARCTVEDCTNTGTLADPGGDWSRDSKGHHFCPAHPATTSCRICGGDKGSNRIICAACARTDSKEQQA
ncbi:hypothetical protein ACIRQH_35105 [Streptomyces sp. NPDC102279]|uniref:hypothetical protein n=1 Tax=Streptomyces sp. NPDC102279 TaxID=3366153 RepID=UPI003826CF13